MKLTFDEVMERISDERIVDKADVLASALKRKVWVAEWHIPGCLSESRCYCTTKADAIAAACSMAEGEDGVPRGMKAWLASMGSFSSDSPLYGRVINTVSAHQLADLL